MVPWYESVSFWTCLVNSQGQHCHYVVDFVEYIAVSPTFVREWFSRKHFCHPLTIMFQFCVLIVLNKISIFFQKKDLLVILMIIIHNYVFDAYVRMYFFPVHFFSMWCRCINFINENTFKIFV